MSIRPPNSNRILEHGARGRGSQSVVPGPAAAPGNFFEVHIFRPTPELLNQKLWAWDQPSGFYGALREILTHVRV